MERLGEPEIGGVGAVQHVDSGTRELRTCTSPLTLTKKGLSTADRIADVSDQISRQSITETKMRTYRSKFAWILYAFRRIFMQETHATGCIRPQSSRIITICSYPRAMGGQARTSLDVRRLPPTEHHTIHGPIRSRFSDPAFDHKYSYFQLSASVIRAVRIGSHGIENGPASAGPSLSFAARGQACAAFRRAFHASWIHVSGIRKNGVRNRPSSELIQISAR